MADDKGKGKGKDEAERKKPIRVDARYYDKLWERKLEALRLDEQEFRYKLIRPGSVNVHLDNVVESCEWRDEGTPGQINTIPVLRGSMTIREPHPDDPFSKIEIRDGYVIRCSVKWGGEWKELWEMRILKTTSGVADGTLTLELADDMILLSKSVYNFSFKQGKKHHKKGFRYWEIVRRIARMTKTPLDRKMPKGERWIKDFDEKKISPLEAIRQAVQLEQDWSGRPHVIRWVDGKVSIKRMRRNPILYTFREQIRSADISKNRKAEPFTAMTGVGSMKKKDKDGKTKNKKIEITVVDRDAVKKFGYIHTQVSLGNKLESREEAKKLLRQKIKESLEPVIVIENFTHYGIAFIRRGDAVRISIPWEQIKGKRGYLFVVSVVHSVSGGDYTMTLTLAIKDPLDPNDLREMREKALRQRKREKKGKDADARAGGGGGGGDGTSPPLEGDYETIGFPYEGTHTLGNWQSDNAVDLGTPVGTPVLAVVDGTIGRVEGPFSNDISGRYSGGSIYLSGDGHQFWYKHLTGSSCSPGDKVRAGERIASSGGGNGVAHLHFAAEPPDDPRDYS